MGAIEEEHLGNEILGKVFTFGELAMRLERKRMSKILIRGRTSGRIGLSY